MHLECRQAIEHIRVIIERIGVIFNNPYALYNPYVVHLIYKK